jgi:elongation factor Ts
MGENTQLSRFASIKGDAVASYIHMGGKIGILVAFELGNAEVGKTDAFKAYGRDIAMQVAAAAPIAATRDEVPAETVEHEMSIYKAQAAESGKPEQIQVKIAEGRMNKFYGEFVLTEQAFVKDPDQKVSAYTNKVAKELGTTIKILGFKRFVLGEAE